MPFRVCTAIILIAFCVGQLAAQSPRPPWTTSRINGAPEPPRPYVIERIFPSLAFDQPVELVAIPGHESPGGPGSRRQDLFVRESADG